jgi:hypothetical protein
MQSGRFDTSTESGQNALVEEYLQKVYSKSSAELGVNPQEVWDSLFSSSGAFKSFNKLANKLSISGLDNISAGTAKELGQAV